MISLRDMLIDAIDFLKKTQHKRNELMQKKLKIQADLNELLKMEERQTLTKSQKHEKFYMKQQLRVLEEDIQTTDLTDESSGSYTTNALTVRRAECNARMILRLIQLLCENHNPYLQNLLRQQTHEDGKQKLNSIDMCQFLSKTLEQFQNIFNDQTFDVCDQLVGTLIEMIQGPCKLNQRSLVNANIIDSSREYIAGFELEAELLPLNMAEEDQIDRIGDFK